MAYIIFYLLCVAFVIDIVCASLKVALRSDGPAVLGADVTFTAIVEGYHDDGQLLEFVYRDNALPQHSDIYFLATNASKWTVTYPRDLYDAGQYTATVDLKLELSSVGILLSYVVDSATITFNLTHSLNGNLVLNQNNRMKSNNFVAVNKTVTHLVKLPENELQFIKGNSSSILTYWFIDCNYIDMTTDFTLNYTYEDVMGQHELDVLVVANHEPLPLLPTTTTTTTTPKPTTTKPPTTPKPDNKTVNPHSIQRRAISNAVLKKANSPLKDFNCNIILPMDEYHTYGHYKETIHVIEPEPIDITGLNWLQHGDLMNLQVEYSGSPPFRYCAIYKDGQYNITGNETCPTNSSTSTSVMTNRFQLVHYFSDSNQRTAVVIIENDIGKVVSTATINVYKGT